MKNIILICSFCFVANLSAAQHKEYLYVGTYSIRDGDGIFVYEFNRARRSLSLVQRVKTLESPTYLEIHPSRKFLYAVNRGSISSAEPGGSVTAYSISKTTGKLTFLGNRPSYGSNPCHISIDNTGNYAFVSNYEEGNLVVFPLFEDGLIGNPTDSKKYSGSSIHESRQRTPHIHMAQVSPDNRFVFVSDLGTDKLYRYQFDENDGKLLSTSQNEINVAPGAGPRHFTFHPSGKSFYLIEELYSTVAQFEYQNTTGTLTLVQDSIESLAPTYTGKNTSADIHVHPNGRFLYVSNRGANTIAIFAIQANGSLKRISEQSTNGKTPRNFVIDKKGEYLMVGNQESDSITMFKINSKTGKLTPMPTVVKVKSPACLKLY